MARFLWRNGERGRLRGLVDGCEMWRKRQRYWPIGEWAGVFGCCENAVRNELARGLCRMGSEEKGFYFVYDPAVAEEHRRHAAFNQGNKSLLERKSKNTAFMKAVKFLCELLLRKRCVKRGGFRSFYYIGGEQCGVRHYGIDKHLQVP